VVNKDVQSHDGEIWRERADLGLPSHA